MALGGQLHREMVFPGQLHHYFRRLGRNVVALKQFPCGNLADLPAVTQNAQVFPRRSCVHRRREKHMLPPGGGYDGHPAGVGVHQSPVEPWGKALVVGLQRGAVQIHRKKLNVHLSNLLT